MLTAKIADENDWMTVRDLRLSALSNTSGIFYSGDEPPADADAEWRAYVKKRTQDGNAIVIAYNDGVPVAMCGGKPNPYKDDAFIMHSLWVEARARGLGVAKLMIAEHTRQARAQGYKYIQACTKDSNEATRSLYRNLGYAEMTEPSEFRPVQAPPEILYVSALAETTG